MVSGFATGRMVSLPVSKAVATGAQPAGWPPMWRVVGASMRPTVASSSNPRRSFVYSDPDAMGATMASGARHPSCSAISKATLFDPSE